MDQEKVKKSHNVTILGFKKKWVFKEKVLKVSSITLRTLDQKAQKVSSLRIYKNDKTNAIRAPCSTPL